MEMTLVPTGFYDLTIFKSMTRDEVDEIGRLANPRHFDAGDTLFREKNEGNFLDIIWSGSVEITKTDPDGESRQITVVHAPSVVGEMSLMSGLARSCSGTAVKEAMVYRIRREDFEEQLDKGSLAAYKVVRNLAQLMSFRMRTVDEKLVQVLNERDDAAANVQEDAGEFADFRKKLLTEWTF